MKYILFYLLFINLTAFLFMGIDKQKAKTGKRRTKEKTLFLTAFFGGSVGCILGMSIFRHKTKHNSFTLGMPAILALQIAAAFLIKNILT